MAKYRCLQDTFIAPQLLKEGAVFTINDEWEPGPHLEPLDEAAQTAVEAYVKKMAALGIRNPLEPVEDLPVTLLQVEDVGGKPAEEVNLTAVEANASSAGAKPGPTEAKK